MTGERVLIVGFGNRLMGDDGIGPEVVRRLAERGLTRSVTALEAESDSLILPSLWTGQPQVWLVDALIRGATPGTVHRLDHDEILGIPQRHATVHHLSLPESLRWIAHTFPEMSAVRYRLWGVEPDRIDLGTGLGRAAELAVRTVVEDIRAALAGTRGTS